MKKTALFIALLIVMASCTSTKSTLKNVDNNAPIPRLTTEQYFCNYRIQQRQKIRL